MTPAELRRRVGAALGARVEGLEPLGGGMVGAVRLARLEGAASVVVKTTPGVDARVEAAMLSRLRPHLPVPGVLHAERELLVLERLPGRPGLDGPAAQRHAAELLAALHAAPAGETFGLEEVTLLGPFRLPNPPTRDWAAFFAAHRLRYFADLAQARDALPAGWRGRLERVAERCPEVLDHRPVPALVHGDLWAGNVLADGGRVTGVLDPACHRADPETELAFLELFATVGAPFRDAYRALRGVGEGDERRRDLYQLPPLLVHAALFGSSYLSAIDARLRRLGA